jgi:serine/threonine protein kinase
MTAVLLHRCFQYIAPERAGGLPHDTRKADVWSLGITFFEILVGRTPFEHGESEKFITTEDLKKYWQRTVSEALRCSSTI